MQYHNVTSVDNTMLMSMATHKLCVAMDMSMVLHILLFHHWLLLSPCVWLRVTAEAMIGAQSHCRSSECLHGIGVTSPINL